MIELTMTEAEHILDVLEEVRRDPDAVIEDMQEEINSSIEILSECIARGAVRSVDK